MRLVVDDCEPENVLQIDAVINEQSKNRFMSLLCSDPEL
jgi:hypothetical protein